ncbi:GSCOCG00012682001-RA-CDS [Cotesia congregata]|nr:GSCOCG00012682001-RA-CDS [Cotesia congregata]
MSKSRRFIGMTVHWIDENTFVRKSYAIACQRFPGSHTHDRVAKMIEEIHQSFGINRDKVVATVTDNGSNFIKAFRVCGIDFDDFFSKGNAL